MVDQLVLWRDTSVPVAENTVLRHDVQGGGMVATALVAVARLGGEAAFWGVVGTDWSARLIVEGLEQEGVDVRHVRRVEGHCGPVTLVSVDGVTGERQFLFFHRVPEGDEPLGDLAELQTAGCLIVDDVRLRSALRAAAEAKRLGVPVVGDLHHLGHDDPLVSHVDYAIVSEYVALRDCGGDLRRACETLRARGPRCVVITRGADGLVCLSDEGYVERAAFPVDAIDTTGAGDTFHGAFCWGLLQGLGLEDNLTFSSAVAAIKCGKLGGRAGIPTQDEAVSFLADRGIRLPLRQTRQDS